MFEHYEKYFTKKLRAMVELTHRDERSKVAMLGMFNKIENALVKRAKLPIEVISSSLCSCKDGHGLLARGLAYKYLDMSDIEDQTITNPYKFRFNADLRPYQVEAKNAMRVNDGGVILMPTGSGKTIAALGAIATIGQRTLFIAHTSEIINQTAEAAEKIFGESVGYIGGGTLDIKPFTVGLIQSVVNIDQVIMDEFGMVILDECLAGDTVVITEKGQVEMKDISTLHCKKVLTVEGEYIMMKPILKHWCSGEKDIYEIETVAGKRLKCTGNHPIMTKTGWKRAETISPDDIVLTLVSTNAGIFCDETKVKYTAVKSIRKTGKEKVYDITVEDTHTFFANGILVHNCHHLPADTFSETMSRCRAKKRFGLTATLERKDGLHGITRAILGDVICKVDVQDIAEYISLPTVYKVTTEYELHKSDYCFKVCKYHGRCKPIKAVKDEETGSINWKKLKKGSCKILDFRLWQHMVGEFVADIKRNELILSVFNSTKGKNNLVLTDRVEHAITLGNMMVEAGHDNVKTLHGQVNKYERDVGIQDFKTNGGTICATTKLFGEGFDAPDIDRMYLVVPSASKINIKQRLGRAMRKKDEAPIAFDFVDRTEITEASWWKRYREYKAMGIEIKFYDGNIGKQNHEQTLLFR